MLILKHILIPPPYELEKHIKEYWYLQIEKDLNQACEVTSFANNSIGITFIVENGKEVYKSVIHGVSTKPAKIVTAQSLTVFGVNFYPSAFYGFFGIDAHYLTNREILLTELIDPDFENSVFNAENLFDKFNIISKFLFKRLQSSFNNDLIVNDLILKIESQNGQVNLKELYKNYSLCERQVQRRFLKTTGVNPSHFAKLARFHEASKILKTFENLKYTDLAYRLNYADQSHFIKETQLLSGMSPKALHNLIKTHSVNSKGSSKYLITLKNITSS